MDVTIITIFGEREFDLTAGQTIQLLTAAEKWEKLSGCAPMPEPEKDLEVQQDVGEEPEQTGEAPEPEDEKTEPVKPMSRAERMFGPKEAWGKSKTPKPTVLQDRYNGFLFCKCDGCGELRAFCAKVPINTYRCLCGCETPLSAMRKIKFACKCGHKYHYLTNARDEWIEVNCINCGSPAALILGNKGDYVQM